jgi:hypothetical protein
VHAKTDEPEIGPGIDRRCPPGSTVWRATVRPPQHPTSAPILAWRHPLVRYPGPRPHAAPRRANLRNFPEGYYRNFRARACPLKSLNHIGGNQAVLPQTSLKTGLFLSGGRSARYFIVGCSVLLAMVSIVISIEVSVATAWSGAAPSIEIMNRTRKGDRLPLVPAFHQNAVNLPLQVDVPRTPAPSPGLLEGCESLASSLAPSLLAHTAGRCLS